MRVWLIVPTFNERENIAVVLRAAAAELARAAPDDHRLLVVDDASPDGTAEAAEELARELPVEVLRRPVKDGLGRAYLAGFERAVQGGAEFVLVMDADLSHDPVHIPALLAAAEDADVVLGSRYVPGGRVENWPRLRRLLSRAGSAYARWLLGVHVRDLTGGYRCIRREALVAVHPRTLRSQGYVFNIEFAYRALRAGLRVVEVPITFRDRTIGQSKISLGIAIEALWLVPVLRLSRPPRQLVTPGSQLADPEAVDPSSDPPSVEATSEGAPLGDSLRT